jgi:hypothetical protein
MSGPPETVKDPAICRADLMTRKVIANVRHADIREFRGDGLNRGIELLLHEVSLGANLRPPRTALAAKPQIVADRASTAEISICGRYHL